MIDHLTAHSNDTLIFNWTVIFGSHEVKINVDPDNQIAERNDDNNILMDCITGYRITDFSNMSIWADASVRHAVEIQMGIEGISDPNISGTQNNIGKFVDFAADNDFDYSLIRVGYTDEQLGGIRESSLKMYYWDVYDNLSLIHI